MDEWMLMFLQPILELIISGRLFSELINHLADVAMSGEDEIQFGFDWLGLIPDSNERKYVRKVNCHNQTEYLFQSSFLIFCHPLSYFSHLHQLSLQPSSNHLNCMMMFSSSLPRFLLNPLNTDLMPCYVFFPSLLLS